MTSGLRIVVPGANFTRNVGQLAYPINVSLKALFYIGGSEEQSIINRAMSEPPGSMSTPPSGYFDGYARFSGPISYLQTAAQDTSRDMTMIAVVRSLSGGANIMGNYDNSAGSTGLSLGNDGLLKFNISNNTAPAGITASIASAGRFVFVAGVCSEASASLVVSGVDGVLHTSTLASPFERVLSATRFRVGSNFGTSAPTGNQDIAMAAIHSMALSPAQLQQAYKYLRSRLAKQGVAI